MKKLAILILACACDLQPAPKHQAAPPAPAAPTPPAAPAEPVRVTGAGSAAAIGSAAAPPVVQASAECEAAGVKIAELMIKSAEPSQMPTIVRERSNIVLHTEQACTKQGWTAPALACIAQSKTDNDAHACLEKFPPPGTNPPATGSGAGSAALPMRHPVAHPRR